MGRRKRSKRSHHRSEKRRRRHDTDDSASDSSSNSSNDKRKRDHSLRRKITEKPRTRDNSSVNQSRSGRNTSNRTVVTPELDNVISATGRGTESRGREVVRSRISATGRDTPQLPREPTGGASSEHRTGDVVAVATPVVAVAEAALHAATAAPVDCSFLGPQTEVPQSGTSGQCNNNVTPNLLVNLNDFSHLLQSLVRPGLPSSINTSVNNMIPEFDPSIKNHRIDSWIAKVNECAKIYRWDQAHIMHYALPKLVGNAKKWYQGQTSVSHDWQHWQTLLRKAFPSETNHGVLLTEMLDRRLKFGENLDEYYYEKIMLLNACEISGKKAVDCLIHGIDDRTIRAGASSARFTEPEDLFKFLKDICKEQKDIVRTSNSNRNRPVNTIICNKCNEPGHRAVQCRAANPQSNQTTGSLLTCFNCKDKGHRLHQCPKPIIKCDECNRFGHSSSNCYQKNNTKNNEKRVMFVDSTNANNMKYYKQAFINNSNSVQCFVDLGSDCTLVTQETVDKLGLKVSKECLPSIRGVADVNIPLLGKTNFSLRIESVEAEITAYVIDNHYLHTSLLVGQNFTELPEVVITKTEKSLNILCRNLLPELPNVDQECVSRKLELFVLSDSELKDVDLLSCYNTDLKNTDVYVPGSYRSINGQEYCIQEGVYKVKNGKCDLLIFNMNNSHPVYFIKDSTIARAYPIVYDDCSTNLSEDSLRCLATHATLEPLSRDDIHINPNLSNIQKDVVYNLINKYRECFAQNLSELGCTNITELDIKLTDDIPVAYRPYRLSHSEKNIVRDIIKELEENKIIEESDSAYASPILLVSKKTGGYRLCVDYRALNRKTVRDLFPLPRIDDQIDLLSGNSYFISLDMSSGYYQIPIKEDCKHLTAFVTPDGLYQFTRAPFGLANCPAVFQRTVNKMLGKSREKCAIAYMDDLLISGKDFDECFNKLEQTFVLLKEAGLTLNINKCRFFDTVISYLGFEISTEGVRPGKAKIDAVTCFPEPKNVHEVRQFMGLASYFRKFIENFATIARPLTDLTKQCNSWKWEQQQREAFLALKEKLTQRPILAIYNPENITELHCDASKFGLGGILFQKESPSSCLKPVAYFSRKTTIDEEKLHAYELETLAVVASLSRFRVYLLGKPFTIITDCNALRSTFAKRDIIPRVARWWIALQEYDCSIEYKPGQAMQHVDALSRNPLPCANDDDKNDHFSRVLQISQDDWLLSLQLSDPKICHIRSALEDPQYKEIADIKQNFVLKNNRLYRKVGEDLKWVVPKSARWQICQRNHDDIGHFSVEKTLEKIKKDFWFSKMKKFITKYVKSCLHCAFGKEPAGPKEGFLHSIPKTDIPFQTVHIDHLGPFVKSSHGNQYILLIIDAYTKFCIIKPLRTTKSSPAIRALKEIFYTFGHPCRLISDRGSCFTSLEFKRFVTEFEIQHILNAVSTPRANGQVERYNRTVLDSLRAYTDRLGENKWDQELGKIQWGLNNTLNKGTGKTPAEALFYKRPLSKGEGILGDTISERRQNDKNVEQIRQEINEHIDKDQSQQKLRFDRNRKEAKVYKIGDLVKILKNVPSNDGKSRKLLPKYTGPFKITDVLGNDRYQVSSIPGSSITRGKYSNIWSADRIQPWITIANDQSDSSDDETDLTRD